MWTMEAPAVKVANMLTTEAHQLAPEVLRLEEGTAAIVVEIDGVDYVLTMMRLPVQRERRAAN